MKRRGLGVPHLALTGLVLCSAKAYAVVFGVPAVAILLLPVAAAAFWKLERMPGGLAALLRWAGWGLVGAAVLLPSLLMMQAIDEPQSRRIATAVGAALALVAAVQMFAKPTAAIPASLGLLTVAGLAYREPLVPVLYAGAAAALVIWLAAERKPRLLPLLVLLGGAAAVAVALGILLPLAQPWVESKMADLASGPKAARAGLSLTSRLGDVERLALSKRVALRVWAERPRYLRARVYARYAGRTWTGSPPRRRLRPGSGLEELPGATWEVAGGATSYRARILQEILVSDTLPAPADLRRVRLGVEPPWVDAAGIVTPIGAPPALYAVECGPGVDLTPPGKEEVEVPPGLDVRLQELASTIRGSAEERIRRTLEELERRCEYALDVGAFRSSDPVGEFVFDKRRGYCEYFASAAALLLRMQGVPARYVVGYSVRPSNLEGGAYVVREADAHAWVEAWVEGRGWVELDPTPAGQFEAMRAPIRGGGWWGRISAWLSETAALFRQGARLAVLLRVGALLGLLGVGVLAIRFLRRPRRPRAPRPVPPPPLPPALAARLRALDEAWSRAGHPRPRSRAPLEHLRSLPADLRGAEGEVLSLYKSLYGA